MTQSSTDGFSTLVEACEANGGEIASILTSAENEAAGTACVESATEGQRTFCTMGLNAKDLVGKFISVFVRFFRAGRPATGLVRPFVRRIFFPL